jgi:hypothetical protein
MTAVIEVYCKKCNENFSLITNGKTKEEITEILKKQTSFECTAGNHVELSSPLNYWVLGEITEKEVPTDKEKLQELKNSYSEVYTTSELQEKYKVTGFSYGTCICENKTNGKKSYFDFTRIGNERYYFKISEVE